MAEEKFETDPAPQTTPGPTPSAGGPEMPRPASSNKWIWVVLAILVLVVLIVLVYYFLITKPTEQPQQVAPVTEEVAPTPGGVGGVPGTTPAAPEKTTEGFKLYKTTPGKEELAEPGQAINFSISYPGDWNYRVLDEEVKAEGAGNILHFVAFGKEPPTLTQEQNRLVIYADSHQFQNMVELVTYEKTAKKTETTCGGQKAVKWVGKKVSPIGTAIEETVTVTVEAPTGWTLVVEGKKTDEQIIDQMLSTLVFLPA